MSDAAMAPAGNDIEQMRAQMAQLQQQLRGLAQERDQYRQQLNAAQQQTQSYAGQQAAAGHPLASLSSYVDGWNPQQVDAYYSDLMRKQGFLTNEQMEQMLANRDAMMQNYTLANIHLFRNVDRVLSQKEYADLQKFDSPLAKKTIEVMQAQGWGKPLEGANSWEKVQYSDPEGFSKAARMARAELMMEQQSQQVQTQEAQQAQQAASLANGQGVPAQQGAQGGFDWRAAIDRGDTAVLDKAIRGEQ